MSPQFGVLSPNFQLGSYSSTQQLCLYPQQSPQAPLYVFASPSPLNTASPYNPVYPISAQISSGSLCSPLAQGFSQLQQLPSTESLADLTARLAASSHMPALDHATIKQLLAAAAAGAPAGQQYNRLYAMAAGSNCGSPSKAVLQAAAQLQSPSGQTASNLPVVLSSPHCPFNQAACEAAASPQVPQQPPRLPATPRATAAPTSTPSSFNSSGALDNFGGTPGWQSNNEYGSMASLFGLQDLTLAQQIDLVNQLQAGRSKLQPQPAPEPQDVSFAPIVDLVNHQQDSCSKTQPQPQADRANRFSESEMLLLPDWLQAELDGINVPGVTTNATSTNLDPASVNSSAVNPQAAAFSTSAAGVSQSQPASVCAVTTHPMDAAPDLSFKRLGGGTLPPGRPTSDGEYTAFGSAGAHGGGAHIAASGTPKPGAGFYAAKQVPARDKMQVATNHNAMRATGTTQVPGKMPGRRQLPAENTTFGTGSKPELGSNQNTKKLLDDLHTSQLQLSSCMQQIKYMSAVSRTASQQHSRKVAALHEQLQAAMDRVQVLEADLAGTRLAMTSKLLAGQRSQQQKGSIDDGGEGDADDQQQVVQKQGTTVATQAASAAKGAGTPKSSTAAQLPRRLWDFEQCEGAAKEDRPTGDGEDSCDGRKAASVQVAELTELLQQARSDVAAPEAELAAARQQAGQACGSAVFARQQVKTLSGQLQEAVEKIVQLENEAAVAKQQAVQATNELQALREASAAAAAAHAATMEVAQVERQCSNASVDQEKAMLRQQLEQEQSNGLQLQAQLKAATEKYEAARAVIKKVPYLAVPQPAWLQAAAPRPTVPAASKPKRAADRVLAGKLKQQAAQWASLHNKATALTAGLRADELRYDASASATFSSLREQGNDIGRAMKALQEGLDAASNLVCALLPPPLELKLASSVDGDGDGCGGEQQQQQQQEEEQPSAQQAEGQLLNSAAAAAVMEGSSGCAAASAASGKHVSNRAQPGSAIVATQDADSASWPAADTTTDGTGSVAAAGTPASSAASQAQVITAAEELGARFAQLTVSQAVDMVPEAGATREQSSNGLGTDMEKQCSTAADGEAVESSDSTLASSFSLGGLSSRLLRLAMRAAAGTK